MRRALFATTTLVTVAALAACSGGGHSTTPVAPVVQQTSSGTASSSGFVYPSSVVASSTFVRPAAFDHYSFDVAMPMRDAKGLHDYAIAVSDPASASYRHFLTPDQIADRFAATAADQKKAIAALQRYGLSVSGWKQRVLLHVAGTQTQLESAFHTTFGLYTTATGQSIVAPMTAPHVDAGVPIVGSANIVLRPQRYHTEFVASTGLGSGYSPQQVAAAFDYNGAYAAGYTGAGITVGIIGTGGIQTTSNGRVGDAEAYRALYHVAGTGTITEVASSPSDPVVNGASGFTSPPPVTAPCSNGNSDFPTANCNPEDGEAQIDTEQTYTLARDANIEFYLAYNPSDGCGAMASPCPVGHNPRIDGIPEQGLAESDEELQTIVDHNTADVVSASFGGAEFGLGGPPGQSPPYEFTTDGTGLDPMEYAMMVTEGMAVFVSSGDAGAEGCQSPTVHGYTDSLCVQYPAVDPSVVGVGGVTAPLNAAGQFVGPVAAWGLQTSAGGSGSGGGVSAYFPMPAWQVGAAGMIGTTRNVPDLSLVGDPSTGVATLVDADPALGGKTLEAFGGTSVAAPQMAAMWALVLQACKQTPSCVAKGSGTHPYRMGNPNPLFYAMYKNATTYGQTFLSTSYGDNALSPYCYYNSGDHANCPTPAPGTSPTPLPVPQPIDSGYSANPNGGYNQITGLGVPFGRALIRAAVGV